MTRFTEDPARWPVSRFMREFVPTHWDGRVVIVALGINWSAAVACALALCLQTEKNALSWLHVLLFAAFPVAGFVQFVRDSANWRPVLQIVVSVAFQFFYAALPWLTLFRSIASGTGVT